MICPGHKLLWPGLYRRKVGKILAICFLRIFAVQGAATAFAGIFVHVSNP